MKSLQPAVSVVLNGDQAGCARTGGVGDSESSFVGDLSLHCHSNSKAYWKVGKSL